jgi:isoleucyl-tRNA synthetase
MTTRVCGKGCLYSEKDKAANKFEIIEKFLGSTLVGLRYTPLFQHYVETHGKTAWRVIADS